MLNMEALDIPPSGRDSFLWTDFAELRALIHPDRCFCQTDLEGVANRRRGMREIDDDPEDSVLDVYRPKKSGFNVTQRWKEIADFVGRRQRDFGASYPFCLSQDKDTVELKRRNLRAKQSVYLGLLIASSLRLVNKNRQNEITRTFEEVSFRIFSRLLPSGSEIRATWANGGSEAPYKGTLYEKMLKVCKDIRCTANFQQRDFKENDTGDGNIDLIAWHPMADDRDSMPIAFAQCGCSKDDWRFKHLEASYAKHAPNLPVRHPWATYYFLPLDLRWPDGDWAYKSDIGQAIIVDRLRLLRLASQYKLHDRLPAMPFIDEVRALRYS